MRSATGVSAEARVLIDLLADFGALVAQIAPGDWDRPTRCEPMPVRELVAHTASGLEGLHGHLFSPVSGPPSADRVTAWRSWDGAGEAGRVVTAAREAAGSRTDDQIAAWWTEQAHAVAEAAGSTAADVVVGGGGRAIRADELVAACVLELGVHEMDLGHALLAGERITPAAAALCVALLGTLLGAALPAAIGWDAKTFILTSTGRRRLSGVERRTLGPLAERFPLIV